MIWKNIASLRKMEKSVVRRESHFNISPIQNHQFILFLVSPKKGSLGLTWKKLSQLWIFEGSIYKVLMCGRVPAIVGFSMCRYNEWSCNTYAMIHFSHFIGFGHAKRVIIKAMGRHL